MDYQTAKRRVLTRRVLGAVIALVAGLFTATGFLLYLHGSLDSAGPALSGLSLALKRAVYAIYERTPLINGIWNMAPIPNPRDPMSRGTLGFLAAYLSMFVGASLIGSANQLARRLRTIERQIEDQAIKDSVQGRPRRAKADIEKNIEIANPAVWKEFHTLYVAPLVVGIVLWGISKIAE